MKSKKKILSLIMAMAMITNIITMPLASSEEELELDEDDLYMTTEMLIGEGGDDWDHETWDEEHQEMVWVVFATSTWQSSIPALKFSEKGAAQIGSGTQKWKDDNYELWSAMKKVVDESTCPEDEKGNYEIFIYALGYVMDAHDGFTTLGPAGWFTDTFAVPTFLIGGKTIDGPNGRDVESAIQIAKRVMDNRSDADDIYSREGVQKVLNGIVKSSWVNDFTRWLWDGDAYSGYHTNSLGVNYIMSGWGGRQDELGDGASYVAPSYNVTRPSSASTAPARPSGATPEPM